MQNQPAIFEAFEIRRVYDEATETWRFSVIDIIQVLTQQPDYQGARKYWKVLKGRLAKEGSELVTNCYQLKILAADGKQRLTDVATAETLLRLVQSVPSPKAEPIKLWLAKVGYERMQEMADPALSLDRARETWQQHGRSEKWIQQRMTGQETRNKLTDYWANHYSFSFIVGYAFKSATIRERNAIWHKCERRVGLIIDNQEMLVICVKCFLCSNFFRAC